MDNHKEIHKKQDDVLYIDYNEKINNFIAITECHVENVYIEYLERFNWDENVNIHINNSRKLQLLI